MHVVLGKGRLASRGRNVLRQVLGLLPTADKSAEESPKRTGLGGDFSWCPGLLGGRPGWTGCEGWLPPPPPGAAQLFHFVLKRQSGAAFKVPQEYISFLIF